MPITFVIIGAVALVFLGIVFAISYIKAPPDMAWQNNTTCTVGLSFSPAPWAKPSEAPWADSPPVRKK